MDSLSVCDGYFRDISDDPSEKELTQQDQFNNDEVVLAEALVRETIQNSTDASANGNHVRVRFALHTISTPARTSIIRQMADGLAPSLKASELAVPQDREIGYALTLARRDRAPAGNEPGPGQCRS